MTRSKVSYDDLQSDVVPKTGDSLGIISYNDLFVNSASGKDTNDGLTPQTAIKTLEKLSAMVSNTHHYNAPSATKTNLNVWFYPGSYPGVLNIHDVHYGLALNNQDPQIGKVIFTYGTMSIHNMSNIALKNISFLPISVSEGSQSILTTSASNLYLYKCEFQGIDARTIYTGIYAQSCKLFMEEVKFLGKTSVPHNHMNSDVRAYKVFYDSSYTGIPLSADTYSYMSPMEGSKQLSTDSIESASLDFNLVNRGIIVETGNNSNGYYVKYGDGTLVCYWTMSAMGPINIAWGSLFITAQKKWNFPYLFVNPPYVGVRELMGVGNTWGILGDIATTNDGTWFKMATSSKQDTITPWVSLFAIGRWK